MKCRHCVSAALFLVILALFPVLAHGDEGGITLRATDGETQITLPSGWNQNDGDKPDPDIQIWAFNSQRRCTLSVRTIRNSDTSDSFSQYAERRRDRMTNWLQDSTTGEGKEYSINGWDTIQYEVHGTSPKNHLKYGYFVTVINTNKHIIEVLSYCIESRFDENSDMLHQLANGASESSDN